MSVPLDGDGFLRRECPTCEREFKWLVAGDDDTESVPDVGYFCPYCAVQAPARKWFTKAQIELAQNILIREVLGPQLNDMARDLRRSTRGGLISMDLKYDEPEALDPLVEDDDMRRVDFECHPDEPVKVLEGWDREVHCLICGSAAPSVT